MQAYFDIAVIGYMIGGILFGFANGYVIGGMPDLKATDRVVLGIIISFIGGLFIGLVLAEFIPPVSASLLIAVLSSLGGCVFGEMVRWAPAPPKPSKRHVIYEPDDDEAFDREIEAALGGSQ